MIIIILAVTLFFIFFYCIKIIITKRIQINYESALLKGDKKKANQLGKIYYISLDEENRKAKGIIDIEAKISDDFRAFNTHLLI